MCEKSKDRPGTSLEKVRDPGGSPKGVRETQSRIAAAIHRRQVPVVNCMNLPVDSDRDREFDSDPSGMVIVFLFFSILGFAWGVAATLLFQWLT